MNALYENCTRGLPYSRKIEHFCYYELNTILTIHFSAINGNTPALKTPCLKFHHATSGLTYVSVLSSSSSKRICQQRSNIFCDKGYPPYRGCSRSANYAHILFNTNKLIHNGFAGIRRNILFALKQFK